MPPLIDCRDISKAFGAAPLFDRLSLTIDEGARLGIIGANGSGKTTLLEILAGAQEPDSGTRSVRKLLRLAYVAQESRFPEDATVAELLTPETMGKAGFTRGDARIATLSGGWRKRLAIAQALATEPDVLLLDEPTNHLDLEGIAWLEKLLGAAPFAVVLVSHDRYFLENTTTSMAELSRQYTDGLLRVEGNYSEFLTRREEALDAQARHQEALANVVRQEIEWLRRGAKARTSKSKARIDAAGRMIDELADLNERSRTGAVQVDFQASGRKTKLLMELTGVSMSIAGRALFRGLDLRLAPGRRIGLVGPNGSGKSTLLKILRGELEPDDGSVRRADGVRIVYFDQNRAQLDPEQTLRRTLVERGDSVIYQDRPQHIVGWAKRFLFRPEQLDMPVGKLSGGERARVLIAKLMLEAADVLLLDEPTNDLDIPTLEVLEENLASFAGALVLVTHDRFMLDRVSTMVLGLDGEGGAGLFADYEQWEAARKPRAPAAPARQPAKSEQVSPKKPRLSYIEGREYETMEARISEAEAKLKSAENALADPAVNTNPARLTEAYANLQAAQREVDALYARWEELEGKLA